MADLLWPALALVLIEEPVDELSGVLRGERGVPQPHEVAVEAHDRRGADRQMEVAGTAGDHVGDELGEVDHGHLSRGRTIGP